MTVYLIAEVKVTDDAWVPAYAGRCMTSCTNTAASTSHGAAMWGH